MVSLHKTFRLPGLWNWSRKILLLPCRRQASSLVRKEIVTQSSNPDSTNSLLAATTVFAVAAILCTNDSSCNSSAHNSTSIKNADSPTSTDDDPTALPTAFLVELHKLLPSDQIEDHIESLKQRGKPWNSYHRLASYPRIIVSPSSTEQVSAVVKLCHQHHVLLIPFGGGTSIEGQTLAPLGGVSLDFSHMREVLELNEVVLVLPIYTLYPHTLPIKPPQTPQTTFEIHNVNSPDQHNLSTIVSIQVDLDVRVQAGLGYIELNDLLRPKGLWFPLDPGPGAQIGGMCACRCSGSTAVKYGSMRENVLNLTAVLPDGTIIKTGSRARKSSAGNTISSVVNTYYRQSLCQYTLYQQSLCQYTCQQTLYTTLPILQRHSIKVHPKQTLSTLFHHTLQDTI